MAANPIGDLYCSCPRHGRYHLGDGGRCCECGLSLCPNCEPKPLPNALETCDSEGCMVAAVGKLVRDRYSLWRHEAVMRTVKERAETLERMSGEFLADVDRRLQR